MADVIEDQDVDAATAVQDVDAATAVPDAAAVVDARLMRELSERAREQGLRLTGEDGLLARFDQGGDRGRARGRDGRAPGLRQARPGGP
jgi:hypothetical protein